MNVAIPEATSLAAWKQIAEERLLAVETWKAKSLALETALRSIGFLDVTNLGSVAQSGRPARYFECRLCGDWNDKAKHIEHADGCPLR